MSLATRCIHCGTIFKIVEDQLKVSEGWVRCGRCNEVFNALPTLFDMDSEAPPPRRTPPAPPFFEPAKAEVTSPAPERTQPPEPDPVATEPAPFSSQLEDELPPEPSMPVRGTTEFDLDTRLPAEEMSLVRRPTPVADQPEPPRTPAPLAPQPLPNNELPSTDEADALDSRYLMPTQRERAAPRHRSRGHGPEFADAEFPTDALLDDDAEDMGLPSPVEAPPPPERVKAKPAEKPTATPSAAAPPATAARAATVKKPSKKAAPAANTPDFIRQAQRQAFWRRPSVRGVLTGLTLALMLSLGVQLLHQFRDALAAQQPSLRPWLAQWCELVHCTLQPPLRINDLQVDSATLLRADSEGLNRYRFTVVVRNRGAIALAWPHVDLTLTDTSGAVVARRSFSPADATWHDGSEPGAQATPRPAAVPPQRSTTLVWQLHAPTLQPAGYTAELFYP